MTAAQPGFYLNGHYVFIGSGGLYQGKYIISSNGRDWRMYDMGISTVNVGVRVVANPYGVVFAPPASTAGGNYPVVSFP